MPFAMRHNPIWKATVCAALLVSFCTAPAFAQRDEARPNIEDLLPETTVAFIQIPDIRDLIEKTQQGAGWKMLEEESIAPLYERVVEEGRKAYTENVEGEVGLTLEEIAAIPSGEMVLSVIAPRRKNPVYMVILEIGEENAAADKAMGIFKEKAAEGEGVEFEDAELESGFEVERSTIDGEPFFMANHQGLIVGCTNEKVLNEFFVRWDGGEIKKVRPLSQNRKFITIMNRCRSKKDYPSDIKFFVDPIKLIKSAGRGDLGTQAAIAMFPSIGLDTVGAVGGSVILGDDEYEAILHGHLLLSNPRKGVTKVISLKPGEYEPELWVPGDAYFYMTTSWDVPQMFEELRGIFDLALEEGTFDTFIQENIDENIEMSLENDILSLFDGRISVTQVGVDPGKANSGSVLVGLGLKDPEKTKETAQQLMEYFNETFDAGLVEKKYEGFTYWSFDSEANARRQEEQEERRNERRRRRGDTEEEMQERETRRNERLATVRIPNPSFAIIGNSLVFSDSTAAFEMAAATEKGEHEPLRNDEEFVKMSEQMTRLLGTDMPVALSYSQPKHQLEQMLQYGNADSTRSFISSQAEDEDDGFWKVVKGVMDDHDLPSMDVMTKYIVPQGWFMTSDDTGYHFLWFQERLVLEDE